jgi:hypothetical protein
MKIMTLIRISGMILLAIVASLAMLALIYLTQHPQLIATLATVSWNG